MSWARWERATGCTDGPAPGALALRTWFAEALPQGWSGGIFNCRTVRGSRTPSIHGEGRALDWMLPVVNGRGDPDGREVIARLKPVGARLGIQCVIFDRSIWSARSPDSRRYTGVHPHHDHIHIELTRAAASSLTYSDLKRNTVYQPPRAPVTRPTVRRGSKGSAVVELQRLVGAKPDGLFGPRTERAVKSYQRRHGLKVDGIVGPATWSSLL